MFAPNSNQQMSIYDSVHNMPEYLKDIIKNSWAETFQKHIFPAINEERFAVLYSDKPSRPNAPVNVIFGALILKEVFNLTDEELIGAIHFDDRFQYALRLTSEKRPPISYNTFINFRRRLKNYMEETGIDLVQEEMEENINPIIADKLEVKGEKVRVDSFMVSSSCKNMSRLELIYTVNNNFIRMLNDNYPDLIPEDCKSYLEEGHKNDTIYRTRDKETESKIEFLLKQSKTLYDAGKNAGKQVTETEEFKTLKRMLGEQTKGDDDDFDNYEPKASKNLSSDSLQNPSDPDATYRIKYDSNVGFVANVAEIFNGDNCLISFYDFKPNIYSDQKFCRDSIDKISDNNNFVTATDNEKLNTWDNISDYINMFIDGTYFSFELAKKALQKGISLLPGELTGKKPAVDKVSYADFKLDAHNKISDCPDGKKPEFSIHYADTKTYTARFNEKTCDDCSLKEACRVQKIKDGYSIRFSRKQYETARLRQKIKTEDYKKLTNQRAGIEGIPSVFRRKYNIDNMPVRGLVRSKIWFGFKVAAMNVKKLFKNYQAQGV